MLCSTAFVDSSVTGLRDNRTNVRLRSMRSLADPSLLALPEPIEVSAAAVPTITTAAVHTRNAFSLRKFIAHCPFPRRMRQEPAPGAA